MVTVTPKGSETAKALMQVLRLVTDGLMAETFAEVGRQGEAVTAAQFEVLRYIDGHLDPTIGEVADGLGTSSAAATKAVNGLAERVQPLVQRWRGEDDRRTVLVRTTDLGRQVVEQVREGFTARLDGVLGRMAPDARQALDRGVRAMLEAALTSERECAAACLRCGVETSPDCVVHLAELALGGRRGER